MTNLKIAIISLAIAVLALASLVFYLVVCNMQTPHTHDFSNPVYVLEQDAVCITCGYSGSEAELQNHISSCMEQDGSVVHAYSVQSPSRYVLVGYQCACGKRA